MKEEMKKTAELIQKQCQADDFTLQIYRTDDLRTRFAQNAVTQHINGANITIRLDVSFDNKTGTASTNQTDDDSLKNLVKKAENIARLNKPDPEFVPSENAHELREPINPHRATTELQVEKIVDDIVECIRNAEGRDARVSGISEKNVTKYFMQTGNGFEGYDESASFSHSMTMKKGGVETKVYRALSDYAEFSIDEMISQLNSQFDSLQEPQPGQIRRIPVILRPQAVLSWFLYLFWIFRLREADEGMTPFTDQIGKEFFGKDFSIHSTINDPKIETPVFTPDGLPTENIDWIVNGVIKKMQVDRYYARKKEIKPAMLFNMVIDGGDATEENMMKQVERGVIVNNLWYIRPVDTKSGEWTGLTRDGVLYFENGEIQHSLTNFRWNEVLHDVTKRILALGPPVQLRPEIVVPTMLIDDFNFVDVTTF